MPDGGGLRLTVAEYLTPALHHVTKVGGAQFDARTGLWVGGGIPPDVMCESSHGIPSHVGGDLCVGVGLDILQEARSTLQEQQQQHLRLKAVHVGNPITKHAGGMADAGKQGHYPSSVSITDFCFISLVNGHLPSVRSLTCDSFHQSKFRMIFRGRQENEHDSQEEIVAQTRYQVSN